MRPYPRSYITLYLQDTIHRMQPLMDLSDKDSMEGGSPGELVSERAIQVSDHEQRLIASSCALFTSKILARVMNGVETFIPQTSTHISDCKSRRLIEAFRMRKVSQVTLDSSTPSQLLI